MNYLAHIYLSGDHSEVMVGGLLGDFIKGPLHGEWPEHIEKGILLHRKIDAFTDQLPEVQVATARFKPPFRRFAGICLDICYDHFLAKHWNEHHHQSLSEFCQQFYRNLSEHYEQLPDRAKRFCDIAPGINWLEGYRHFKNLEMMLMRVGERFRKTVPLHETFPFLQQNYQQLELEFDQFFPRLIAFADSQRQQL